VCVCVCVIGEDSKSCDESSPPNNDKRVLFGIAVMISATISRDTGFGLQLDSTKLAKINYSRQGKKYINEAVAMHVLNCTEKKEIKESPFIKYFELGANNEGYWGHSNQATIWCCSWKTVLIGPEGSLVSP
jgi:hypothetical protein